MLEIARERAGGLANIDFVQGDLESIELPERSFDVVLSRFGLMFAVDHVAAFRRIASLLVPGGVLAAAVWGPSRTQLMSQGPAALAERLEMPAPPPDAPGPFSMSDPERLSRELSEAGFVDVSVADVVAPFEFATVSGYVRYTRAMMPPAFLEKVRESFGSEDAPEAWDAVGDAVALHAGDDGVVRLPSTALCLRAVAP
jgi:SAM-dependent methyltransferase